MEMLLCRCLPDASNVLFFLQEKRFPNLLTSSFAVLIPLHHYQQKHPLNFVFLGLFTLCLSLSIGVACANTEG